MIIGYIGCTLCTANVYFGLAENSTENSNLNDANTSVQKADTASFFFIALAASSYLHHSWLRAKSILFYKYKIWHKIFDVVVKITDLFLFLPVIFQGLSFILKMGKLSEIASIFQGIGGIIVFAFDCFIISIFSRFFIFPNHPSNVEGKYTLIAKYGIMASIGVLLCDICNALFFYFLRIEEPMIANVFLIATDVFLFVPIWAFTTLKVKLKEYRATLASKRRNSNQLNQVAVSS